MRKLGYIRAGASLLLCFVLCCKMQALSPQAATDDRQQLQAAVAEGSAALQKSDYATAEHAFREALALQPNSIPILNDLALSLARQQREDEAIVLYRRALQLKPGDPVTQRNLGIAYFRARQYGPALPFLEAFAEQTHSFEAMDLTGLDLFALDRYQEAARYLQDANKLNPGDIQTLDMLGKAYLRTQNYAAVTEVFRQMMVLHPESAEAHVMMATAEDKLFREDDAIREFKTAETIDPKYPGIHTGLGLIYWRSDNAPAAEQEFRQELARYPKDPIANCTLGRILRRLQKPAEAVPYLEAALAENPNYRDALLELGECRIALQQPSDAIAPLRRAIALQPDDVEAHYILGSALSKAGDREEGAKERAICARLRARQGAAPR